MADSAQFSALFGDGRAVAGGPPTKVNKPSFSRDITGAGSR